MSIQSKIVDFLRGWYGLTASVVSGVINLNVSGRVRTGDGTASDPAWSFTSDTDVGWYRSAANQMRAAVNNADVVLIGSNSVNFHRDAVFAWGSSGVSSDDTNLSRSAAAVVKANGWLQQAGARSRVANDVTNVTITPANITGLSATLIAGRKYSGKLVLYCSEATAADGLRVDFDGGTATMTSFIAQGWLSDDTSVRQIARVTALATDITETTITGSTVVEINFSLVCDAAGTFIPRFAKEADAAGAALTVTTNSYMWLEDTP